MNVNDGRYVPLNLQLESGEQLANAAVRLESHLADVVRVEGTADQIEGLSQRVRLGADEQAKRRARRKAQRKARRHNR